MRNVRDGPLSLFLQYVTSAVVGDMCNLPSLRSQNAIIALRFACGSVVWSKFMTFEDTDSHAIKCETGGDVIVAQVDRSKQSSTVSGSYTADHFFLMPLLILSSILNSYWLRPGLGVPDIVFN